MLAASSVQTVEVFWFCVGISGAILASINTRLAHRAVRALKKLGITNGRTRIAKGARRTEFVRLVIQLIEVYLGIVAMTIPAGPGLNGLPFKLQFKAYSIQYGIIACAILTLIQSINSYTLRRYFLGAKPQTRRDDDESDLA